MKVISIARTVYITASTKDCKRPLGELYKVFADSQLAGSFLIHEWHVNSGSNSDRRAFALIAAKTAASSEIPNWSILHNKAIVEFRSEGSESIRLDHPTVRMELRLTFDVRHAGIQGRKCQLISTDDRISIPVYVPSSTGDALEAIISEVDSHSEYLLSASNGLDFTLLPCD